MKQQSAEANYYHPTFRVIKGNKDAQPEINSLVKAAWNFAFSALWNNSNFSKAEAENACLLIKEIITSTKTPLKGYKTFCQRVLLTRHYVTAQPNRFVPLPTIWLNPEYQNGYVGTEEWLNKITAVRASLPGFKIELKAFAEAVLEMSEEPTAKNFTYWRNYFVEKKMPGLLSLFLNTIANGQFA